MACEQHTIQMFSKEQRLQHSGKGVVVKEDGNIACRRHDANMLATLFTKQVGMHCNIHTGSELVAVSNLDS